MNFLSVEKTVLTSKNSDLALLICQRHRILLVCYLCFVVVVVAVVVVVV